MANTCFNYLDSFTQLFKQLTVKIPKSTDEFYEAISLVTALKGQPIGNLETFARMLMEKGESLFKSNKDIFGDNTETLVTLVKQLNKDAIINNINNRSVSNTPEIEEKPSRAVGDKPDTFNTLTQFNDRYGTTMARKQLLDEVHEAVRTTFIISKEGYEINSREQLNRSVREHQEQIYKKVLQFIEKHKNLDQYNLLPQTVYENKKYTLAIEVLNSIIDTLNITSDTLHQLYKKAYNEGDNESKDYLEFINNASLLQFYDILVTHDLQDIEIAHGLTGIYSDTDKYSLNYRNRNMTTTFRDEDSEVDGINESSDFVKRLKSLPAYTASDQPKSGVFINDVAISLINAQLKNKVHSKQFNEVKGVNGRSISWLIAKASRDNTEGYFNLYKSLYEAIKRGKDLGLKTKEKEVILSIWHGIFSDQDSDLQSYLNVKKRTITSLFEKQVHINNQPMYLYDMIVQNLATQETIKQQSYEKEENKTTAKTLESRLQDGKTFYIDQMLNGKFSTAFNQQFKSFVTKLSISGDKPVLTVTIGDKGYAITKKGKDLATSVSLQYNGRPIKFASLSAEQEKEILSQLSEFFKETLKINVNQEGFYETFKNLHQSVLQPLVSMVSNVLYAYEVSKQLYTQDLSRQEYQAKLQEYYDSTEIPKISKSSKQLVYTNNQDTNTKIDLAVTKEVLNNILTGNIVKDSEGKQMSLVGLSQLATRLEQQLQRIEENKTYVTNVGIKQDTIENAVSNFTAKKVYKGVEFTRDYDGGNGVTKKATKFSEAEHFYSSFVLDYLEGIYGSDFTKFTPAIISDKSKLIKAKMDLDQTVNIDGENIRIKDLSIEQIHKLTSKELGAYYTQIYKNIESKYEKLEDVTGFTFDFYHNFNAFNEEVQKLNHFTEIRERIAFLETYPTALTSEELQENKEIVRSIESNQFKLDLLAKYGEDVTVDDILHETLLIAPDVELYSVMDYSIKGGKLKANALLFDQLYRWDCVDYIYDPAKDVLEEYTLVPQSTYESFKTEDGQFLLDTGYGTAEKFFEAKYLDFISDLIYDDCEIRLYDSNFKQLESTGLNKLGKRKTFIKGEYISLANVVYTDNAGKERTLKLIDKDSILNSWVYKQIHKSISYHKRNSGDNSPYTSIGNAYNPTDATFNVGKFIEALEIWNEEQRHPSTIFNKVLSQNSDISEALLGYANPNKDLPNSEVKRFLNQQFIENGIIDRIISGEITEAQQIIPTTNKNLTKALNKFITKIKENYNDVVDSNVKLEIHPDLAKYAALDYWMSAEYVNMSVGTHVNHPAKGDTLRQQESVAWGNQTKRNVSMTAAKHVFAQNMLTGIRSKYKAAVIRNNEDDVYTVNGVATKWPIDDGATYCSIATNYLENNSLGPDRAGNNKKQFIHFWKDGHGGVVKTAGFVITNALIRESEFMRRLNRHTLKGVVRNLDGSVNDNIDITKGFNGPINYGDVYYRSFENGKEVIYKITGLSYDKNTGTTVERECLIDGVWESVDAYTVKLSSNLDIWNLFGGENSMQLDPTTTGNNFNDFVVSENSALQLTHAINYVGTMRNPNKSKAEYQSDVHQPLKEALVDYIITEGAIKQGAANVNSTKIYTDDDYELTTTEFDTHDAGIQLNAEHHANGSTVSLMTQVVNALTARGYTIEIGDSVYEALKLLALDAISDYDDPKTNKEFVADIVVRSLITEEISEEGDLKGALLSTITKEYTSNKGNRADLLKSFPLDHPIILGNAISKISSYLTRKAIKLKFPGSMQVLCPSNGIYRLYNDKMLSAYWKEDVKTLGYGNPLVTVNGLNDLGQIELGKTYKIQFADGTEVTRILNTPVDYYQVLSIENEIVSIKEDYSAGRELASYNLTFVGDDGFTYNLWDIDAIMDMWYDDSVDEQRRTLILQEVMQNIDNGKLISVRGGKKVTINNLKIHPYELICGNIYQETFGLLVGDNVSDIVNNQKFFLNRAIANYRNKLTNSNHYDVEFKQISGNHVYLIDIKRGVPKGLKKLKIEKRNSEGEVVQIDAAGKIIRKLSSMSDEIYVDRLGNQIIATEDFEFYANNIKFVNAHFSDAITSDVVEKLKSTESLVKYLKQLSTDLDTETIIKQNKKAIDLLNKELTMLQKSKDQKIKLNSVDLKRLYFNCLEMHTSFIKSLDVIASRTPAQCQQSFMAMKIVGFDQSGLNNAYVSRMQLYLQGSDFDIDKVSLLGYEIRNGHFVKWSPHMQLTSKELLRASENLPFPTGKKVEIIEMNEAWQNALNTANEVGLFNNGRLNLQTPEQINVLAAMIAGANKYGVVQHDILVRAINDHNLYLKKRGVNAKQALVNFASTGIYKTSINPANQVQGQQSVDFVTEEVIKKLAKKMPMGIRSTKFAPGNPMSKFEQLVLTLGGKENVSLVASNLKVFEAISHAFYKELSEGEGDLPHLIFKTTKNGETVDGVDILGTNVKLIANAYTRNPNLSGSIVEALSEVDNYKDAYIYYSGFLSLAADNAKDPTLTKINAGPEMVTLYLAGLALGVPLESLVKIMTSDFAWEITKLINDNVFNDNTGLSGVDAVLKYYLEGPVKAYEKLPFKLQNRIKKIVFKAMEKWGKLPKDSKGEEKQSHIALTNREVVHFLATTRSFDLQAVLKAEKQTDEINKQFKAYDEFKKKLNQDPEEIEETEDVIEETYNSEDTVESTTLNGVEFYAQQRFFKELRRHKRFTKLNFRSAIEVEKDGEVKKYYPYNMIKLLNNMAKEMILVRSFASLNQGLENNLADILKFVRTLEGIMADKVGNNSEFATLNAQWLQVDAPTNIIDFKKYVNDEGYRDFIIKSYDQVKDFINPFRVIQYNDHYSGFLKTAEVQYSMFKDNSTVVKIADEISKTVLASKVKSGDFESYLKKVQKFIFMRINNSWLLTQKGVNIVNPPNPFKNFEITEGEFPIQLGTPSGNATFKYWMDNVVIEDLKKLLPRNKLIQDLELFENTKTESGNGVVQYGLDFVLFPESDQELQDFKEYKQALNQLASETYNGNSVLDLLMYYNTIVYNGEVLTRSLSSFFEDIIIDKTSSTVTDHLNFISNFRKENSFVLGKDYTEDEILQYIAPIVHISNIDSANMDYIRVYSDKQMKYVMLQYARSAANKALEKLDESISDQLQADSEYIQQLKAGYIEFGQDFNAQYYLHNFVPSREEVESNVDTVSYRNKKYTDKELVAIARQNGHSVDNVIVYTQDTEGKLVIDTKLTKKRLTEIFKKKTEC